MKLSVLFRRAWMFVSFAFVGCSLLDPLDGISDGNAPPSSSAVDGGETDGARARVDGSSAWDARACQPEIEDDRPGAPPPQLTLSDSEWSMCGTVSASDTDTFELLFDEGLPYRVRGVFPKPGSGDRFDLSGGANDQSGDALDFATASSDGEPLILTVSTQSASPREWMLTFSRH